MAHFSAVCRLTGLLLLGLPLAPALAQVPMSAYQFTAASSTYAPLDSTATTVPAILADDAVSSAIPLPFPFVFGGQAYTSVIASSNGFLSFAAAPSSALTNSLSSNPANTRPLVAPFWDDLDGRTTTTSQPRAAYRTSGLAPNRVFTFEWRNWGRYPGSPTAQPLLTFQARLYEGSNVVEFSYQPVAALPATSSGSIGLAGAITGDFLSLTNTSAAPTVSFTTETNTLNVAPAAGQLYRFTPPATGACLPVSQLSVGNVTATAATVQFTIPAAATNIVINYQPVAGGAPVILAAPSAPVLLTGLQPGTFYRITVQTQCSGTTATNVASSTFHTLPGNDEPAGASMLPVNSTCQPTSGNLAYATVSAPTGYANPGPCGSTTPYDVWYSFQTPASGSPAVRVTTTGLGSRGLLRAFSGSGPFTEIGCRSTGSSLDLMGLAPATTYYLSLSTSYQVQSDSLGRFGICLTPVPACVPPTQLSVNNITTSSAQLTLQPGNGTVSYTVSYQALPGGPTSSFVATALPITLSNLQAGQRYAVSVTANCASGPAGNPLTVYFNALATTPPANNEPTTATPLPVSSACQPTTSTTVGATWSSSTGSGPGCGASGANGSYLPDVWFSFQTAATPALQNVLVTVAGHPAGQVRLYDGSTRLACVAAAGPNQTAPALTASNLAAGHTYYLSVSGYSAADTTGAFSICLTALTAPVIPANDECAQAAPLPVGSACVPTLVTTTNATVSSLSASSCLSTNPADVWYQVVVPASGSLTLRTSAAPTGTPNALTDTQLAVYDGSCGSLRLLGCNDDSNGTLFASLALNGLAPGATLLVRALGYGTSTGSFSLCATDGAPRPCAAPSNLSVTPSSPTSVVVSFTAAAGSSRFRLVYGLQGGNTTQQVYVTTSPVTLTNLQASATYNLTLYTSCDSLQTATPVVTTPVTTTFTARPTGTAATALAEQLGIYPNPAHTTLHLSVPAALVAQPGLLVIANALGQTVLTRPWSAQASDLHLTLPVSQLAAGVYWLRLHTPAGPLVRRVVVE